MYASWSCGKENRHVERAVLPYHPLPAPPLPGEYLPAQILRTKEPGTLDPWSVHKREKEISNALPNTTPV